ncbi:syndecan isoform X1 [Manduca sexta]|uniref:syndecan isoform X1 n=2 Tax=Manduca sexta TaxID=7130 RepID=UPI00188F323F|nr:syndecan isoform X1 [Manduca sexta]
MNRTPCDPSLLDGVVSETSTEEPYHIQNDGHPSNQDVYIDADEGSGLETDESSGSGWGAGPGPDDEDGRGSGDAVQLPEDDEDFTPLPTSPKQAEPVLPEDTEEPISLDVDPVPSTDPPSPVEVVVPVNAKPNEGVVEEPHGAGEEVPSRPDQTDISISGEETNPSTDQLPSGSNADAESRQREVVIMDVKPEDRATSFFAQPGILAAVIGGAVVGLLCAILVVMFIVYRMRKKDEGSYALDEPKRSPAAASYGKGHNNREFYA